MPLMDGVELIANISQRDIRVPFVVMTAHSVPQLEKSSREHGALDFLEKPIDFAKLSAIIRDRFDRAVDGQMSGISLLSFLQLMNAERKTASVRVTSMGREGMLHIVAGELVDASNGTHKAIDAAMDIISWDTSTMEVSRSQPVGPRIIEERLDYLMLESVRRKDEGSLPLTLPRATTPAAPAEDMRFDDVVAEFDDAPTSTPPSTPARKQIESPRSVSLPETPPARTVQDMSLDEKANLSRVLRRPDVRAWFAIPKDGTPPISPDMQKAQIDRLKYFVHLATLVGGELGLERASSSLLTCRQKQLLLTERQRYTVVAELTIDADVDAVRAALKEIP
jgi:CheY-like chemotaxis protein